MNRFFNSLFRLGTLDAEARSWVGTPFVPHAMVKGAGVDCVHLVAGVYLACGVLQDFKPQSYSLDEGQHREDSKVLAWFEAHREFQPAATTDLQPGDTICFRLARTEHHAGLMLGHGDFIHALPGRKVTVSNLRESFYRSRITAVFRPMEAAA